MPFFSFHDRIFGVIAVSRKWGGISLAAAGFFSGLVSAAEGDPASTSLPDGSKGESVVQPVTETSFQALKSSSPFLRSLDLSESIILTGIARIEGRLYVTLFRRDTRKTFVVSAEGANPEGWRLVGVDGNQSEIDTVTARIAMAGGEVFSVRFDKDQLKLGEVSTANGRSNSTGSGGPPPPRPQRDYREGVSGDGFRGPPPKEIVEKLSRLDEDTRNRLIQEIGRIRERGVSSEERQVIFRRMVDRAAQQGR